MDVLPRACAALLLLSLLCATGLCQRSKGECSRGRSVCGLPLVLPHGDSAYLSWAPETLVLKWIRHVLCLSSCFLSPWYLGPLSCYPTAVL